jgi:hypothetical protein
MTDLPEPIAELATMLAAMPGAVAVALGGSRALGVGDADSDFLPRLSVAAFWVTGSNPAAST